MRLSVRLGVFLGASTLTAIIYGSCLNACLPAKPVTPAGHAVTYYTYNIVNTFPHDPAAYTQGLAFDGCILYEGTGGYGSSVIRRVDLETGRVLKEFKLDARYFGEGITIYKDTLIQLTWNSHTGFVYDKNSFDLLREFSYPTEGWGITHDGGRIMMSDGTSRIYFLNPESFNAAGYIEVHDEKGPVTRINEMEYIGGRIFANVWKTDNIAVIDPGDGSVTGWIDLSGLREKGRFDNSIDVLNGITYDAGSGRMFVTGKLWPLLFEINIAAK